MALNYVQIKDERYYMDYFASKYRHFLIEKIHGCTWGALVETQGEEMQEIIDGEGATPLEALQNLDTKLNK